MRRRPGSVDVAAGVQRLAGDDDPYAWQERGESPSQQSLLGAFGLQRRRRQRARAAPAARGRGVGARSSRRDHAQHLNELRDARYDELKEEALRQRQITALREDEAAPTTLDRQRDARAARPARRRDAVGVRFPPAPGPRLPGHRCLPRRSTDAAQHGEHDDGEHHEAGRASTTPRRTAIGRGAALAAGAHATGTRRLTDDRDRTRRRARTHARRRTRPWPRPHDRRAGRPRRW